MFIELGAIGAIRYGYKRLKNRDIYALEKYIKDILEENKLEYYTILDVRRNFWGYSVIVNLNGKGFNNLAGIKEFVETRLGYLTFINQNLNLKTATIKIVVLSVDENTKFKPFKTRPFEIYCGLNYTMNELVINLQKFPHVLVSGQTGSGKTEAIRLILSNLINNFTDRDINLYFSDLSDMCDFNKFENCKQTKGYAKNIQDAEQLFSYLMHIYKKRLEIFEKSGCKNIQEYNERFYSKRMSYNYIVMDEMADYYPVKIDTDSEIKERCYDILKHMVRKFRKTGMFLIIGIQRPDTTVLDASLKSGLCTKIGFSQNNDASSKTVCDTTELTNIENRKAMLMYGNIKDWFKTLYIDDNVIENYISSSLVKNRTKLNDYNKFISNKENILEPLKEDKKEIVEKSKTDKITKIDNIKIEKKELANSKKGSSSKIKQEDNIINYKIRVKKNAK